QFSPQAQAKVEPLLEPVSVERGTIEMRTGLDPPRGSCPLIRAAEAKRRLVEGARVAVSHHIGAAVESGPGSRRAADDCECLAERATPRPFRRQARLVDERNVVVVADVGVEQHEPARGGGTRPGRPVETEQRGARKLCNL